MKKLGKLAPFLVAALVVGTFVASELVVRPKEIKDRIRVTYWEKWSGIEFDAIKAVVDEFNDSQDRIYVDLLSVAGIHNKTLMATAAGVPPDVAGLYGPNVAQYVHDRAIIPLDDYCEAAGISRDDYIPVYWDMGVFDGRVYSLPTTPASTALHYNRRLFREAGLNPDSPPRTIEELDEFTERLTIFRKDGKIAQSGFVHKEPGWWNWGWGYIFGGELWDGESKITCDSEENIRAFEWIQRHAQMYGAKNLSSFRDGFGSFASPQNAFMSEKVAMELQGVWMANFIETYNADLDWAAAPFPYPADRPDLAGMTFADEDILVIPVGAKHPDEAFEFIKFVQSQRGMEMLCLLQQKHSPLAEASPEFYAKHPNPYIEMFTNLPKNATVVTPPKIAIWPEYQAELVNAFDEIFINGMAPRVALGKVKKRMQPALDRYLRQKKLREEANR